MNLPLTTVLLLISVGSSSRGGRASSKPMPQDADFENWDKPLEGNSSHPDEGAPASSGELAIGKKKSVHLAAGETRFLRFHLKQAADCELDVTSKGNAPTTAFLDSSLQVAELGTTSTVEAGTSYLRLQSRRAARFSLKLTCSGEDEPKPRSRSKRHRSG